MDGISKPGDQHPLLRAGDKVEAALKDVADTDPAFMGRREKAEALVQLTGLVSLLEAQRMRVIAASDDVADADSCRTVAGWLETRTRTDHAPNHRTMKLAQALDRSWTQVRDGLADGRVNLAQAEVIVRALEELPGDEVPADVLAQAEAHLVAEAAHFPPKALARLGRKILEVVAPAVAEDQERKALEREEAHAARRTSLFTQRLGDGTTRIVARVPDAVAARLATYLDAFTSPRRGTEPLSDRVPSYQAKGHAFGAMLEAFDPKRMPLHGGDATTVMVTISLDQLSEQLGAAGFGFDGQITPGQARRLACTANLIPVVLGTRSEVLDLGRGSRLFSPAQRKALAIRDQRCRAEGCTIPATWCEAHHRHPWSQGGRTDLDDGVLLCSFHHHRVHDDRYLHEDLPGGDIRFSRRN
jgi:hypothetical protein